jgi:hypothetical protein
MHSSLRFSTRCLILEWHSRFQFMDTFAFTESGLDPFRISPFLTEFATATLITGHRSDAALPTALSSSSTARFTGIVHFVKTEAGLEVRQYERLHHTTRPNGTRTPPQCPQCHAYRSWDIASARPKKYNRDLFFRCLTKGCKAVFKAPKLPGYRPLAREEAQLFSKLI